MIKTVFLRNLRQQLPLLLVLFSGLFMFELAVVWVAARIDLGPQFMEFMQSFLPPAFVNIVFNQFGFGSFTGTVSFGYQHPLVLLSGIAMVMVTATIPAQERESEFLDLILARPLSRSSYLTAIVLQLVLTSLLSALVVLCGCAFGLAIVELPEEVAWTGYIPSTAGLFLLLTAVGSYTLLFATEARRRGIAVAQTAGITLVFYWLDFMGDYWDLLETARLINPFHYFDPAQAATTGMTPTQTVVLGSISAIVVPLAFWNFRRQDL